MIGKSVPRVDAYEKVTGNLAGLSAEAQKRTADRAGGLGNPYVCRGSILWRKQCRESAMQ